LFDELSIAAIDFHISEPRGGELEAVGGGESPDRAENGRRGGTGIPVEDEQQGDIERLNWIHCDEVLRSKFTVASGIITAQ